MVYRHQWRHCYYICLEVGTYNTNSSLAQFLILTFLFLRHFSEFSESSESECLHDAFFIMISLLSRNVSDHSCTVSILGSWWSTILLLLLLLLLYCLIIFVFSRCHIAEVAGSQPSGDRHIYQFGAEKINKIIFFLFSFLSYFCSCTIWLFLSK